MVKIKLGPVRAPGEVPIRTDMTVRAPGEVPVRFPVQKLPPSENNRLHPLIEPQPIRVSDKKSFAQKVKGVFTSKKAKKRSESVKRSKSVPKQTPTTQTPRGFNLLSFDINPRRKKQRRLRLNDII